MPTGNENDKSLEAIDWDEFHPTSSYDVYVPRTPPRKKWSIVLGILLYLVGQFSVSLFLPPLLIRAGVISSSEVLSTASGMITAATFWLLIVADIVSVVLIVALVLSFYKEKLSSLGLTTKKLPKAPLIRSNNTSASTRRSRHCHSQRPYQGCCPSFSCPGSLSPL